MKIYPEGTSLFLRDRAADIRTPVSRDGYRKVLRLFQASCPKPVERVKIEDCVAFLTKPNEKTGLPLAPNSILSRKSKLEAFFDWAHWKGLTTATPMAGIDNVVRAKAKKVKIHRWLDDAERKALLAACSDGPLGRRDRVILLLGMYCGFRRSELAALRWGSVQGSVIVGIGKGEKPFQVRMLGPVAEAVMTWRAAWVTGAGRFPTEADPLFPRMRRQWGGGRIEQDIQMCWDEALGYEGVADAVVSAGKRIGIPVATHDLRRTFAGLLEDQGVPIEKISAAMRHANIGTTQVYLAENPRRTIDALDGVVIEL